jgi:hypothetical protein
MPAIVTPGCPSDLGIQLHRWHSEFCIDHPRSLGTQLCKLALMAIPPRRAPHFAIARFFNNTFAQMLAKSVNMGCPLQGNLALNTVFKLQLLQHQGCTCSCTIFTSHDPCPEDQHQ